MSTYYLDHRGRKTRDTEYLYDDTRPAASITREERGNLALLRGLEEYTRLCAPRYADPCAAIEMGIPELFKTCRGMLSYAPDSLRRGAIDSAYADLMRAWHLDPNTGEWTGE